MLLNIFHKRKKKEDNFDSDVSFNMEEIEEFNKQGKALIKSLNDEGILLDNDDSNNNLDVSSDEVLRVYDDNTLDENGLVEGEEDVIDNIIPKEEEVKFSYINLDRDRQVIVTNSIDSIDGLVLDSDIAKGLDLFSHNYTISYCDDAYNFVNDIRDRYDVVIKYLIGFNNEKKGIFNKTIFGKVDSEEWRYLREYVGLLEKIKEIKRNR